MSAAPWLTEEHRRFQARVREFALARIAPVARALDEHSTFPFETVRAMAEEGLLGLPIPRELGGRGMDTLSYILAVEELAKHDASHAITVSAHTTLGTSPIVTFGTGEQRERWVPLLASGRVLGGFGLTEPGAGSDAGGTRTRATRVDGGYRLSGSKIFITHAGVGEIFTVTAVTDPSAGTRGITSFVVTKPTTEPEAARRAGFEPTGLEYVEGVRAGKREDKMGWRASDTRELLLEDAFVPEGNRLGGEGEGFVNFMRTLDAGRIGIAALSLGLAEGAFETACAYTNERGQFGHRLRELQPVQFRLSDMATDIEAGRHLTYHAAWLKEKGEPFTKEAAMAKLFCSELAMRATLQAIQLMGGAGYTSDYPVERMARDAKVCEIGEGTNEIQRIVIGRQILKEAFGD
jgi:butyryl-CoA dehydrogenase